MSSSVLGRVTPAANRPLADAAPEVQWAQLLKSAGSALAPRPAVELEVVIPAFNEERRLPWTLARTVEYLARQPYSSAVVVVDNGSVDRTAEVVRAAAGGPVPVYLLGCARSGKGAAVRRGFATGRSRYVGFMDADLATPVETLDRTMPLLRAGARAVIASRDTAEAERAVAQGTLRQLGGRAFRVVAKTVLPDVADSQCGFKFFSGPEVRAAAATCAIDGFSFDVELLARVQRAGHRVVELPVVWTDVAGSTFSPIRHGLRSLSDTVRIHRLLAQTPRSVPALTLDLQAVERTTPVDRWETRAVG